ncbi:MAG: glycosyltransferase [Planctomycetes bacterium]|nr:glycosyltransferase [Planctomycetota bacterium]
MRVLYVVHQFFPKYISGTEQYVLALARAGRAAGDDVRVYTVDPDWNGADRPETLVRHEFAGVPVVCHDFKKSPVENHVLVDWWNPAVGPNFRAFLDEFRPDIVHFFHLRFLGIERLEEVAARGIKSVVHLMDFWFVCPSFLLLRHEPVVQPNAADSDPATHPHAADSHPAAHKLLQCDGPPDGGYGCFDCVHTVMAPWAREPWARGRHVERRAAGEFPADEQSGEQAGFAMIERPRRVAAALARVDHVIAPSRTVQAAFAKAGLVLPQLEVVPYAIDWSLLEALSAAPVSGIHVGYMGTFAPHKGLAVLLEAMSSLPDGDVTLHCFGRFGDFPGYDARLRELAAGDRRIVFPGPFRREQLASVLGQLQVLVVPSLWRENTPFVALEGRAAGLELITSDLDGMTECVPAGRGRTFAPGDAADLGRALVEAVAAVRARGGKRLPVDRSIPAIAEQWAEFKARYRSLSGR